MENSKCVNCLSRRRFLELSAQSLAALAVTVPAVGLMGACSQQPLESGAGSGSGPAAEGGPTVQNNPANVYTLSYADHPELQAVGGSIRVSIAATSGTKDLFVTRVSSSAVDTVSVICTHAGCTLSPYDSTTQEYTCPCHNSVFAADGAVVTGPAVTPLPSYASTLTPTGVQITVP